MLGNIVSRAVLGNLLVVAGVTLIYLIIFYVIIKAAVRNGTIEAHEKMRLDEDEYGY